MIEILLLSSLVSLATLGALLLRHKLPAALSIPTHKYGSGEASSHQNVKVSKPPLLLWLLVLIATLCFAISYFRDESQTLSAEPSLKTFVWIDRSLSSWMSFQSEFSEKKNLASEVMQNAAEVTFIVPSLVASADGTEWVQDIAFQQANSEAQASEIIKKAYGKQPHPFLYDFTQFSIESEFQNQAELVSGESRLVVLSDGQRSSLNGVSLLSQYFSKIDLVALPPNLPAAKEGTELTPSTLVEAWKGEQELIEPTNQTSDSQTQIANYTGGIPAEARPGIFKTELVSESELKDSLSTSETSEALRLPAILTAESGFPINQKKQSAHISVKTLFTHCTRSPSGPSELSSISDLQALARFFQVTLRSLDCTEADSTKNISGTDKLWKYRLSSLWLVPLSRSVLNTLSYQKRLWLPEGFKPNVDALFYYAHDAGSGGDPDFEYALQRQVVQLEEGSVPTPLFLAPPPPSEPIEPENTKFEILSQGFDGTPLIYQLAGESVYFVRTTLSMPNGELGRSSSWPRFWVNALSSMHKIRGGITSHRLTSPLELDLPAPNELKQFSLNSDSFKSLAADSNYSDVKLNAGLFEKQNTEGANIENSPTDLGHLHIVEYHQSEQDGLFLTEQELRRSFPANATREKPATQQSSDKVNFHTALGVLAGVFALLFFWFKLHKGGATSGASRKSSASTLIIFGLSMATAASAVSETAFAQQNRRALIQPNMQQSLSSLMSSSGKKLPEDIIVPFRVTWCSEENQEKIQLGYRKFRDMLANRGTIHLAKEISFGKCFPGGADIWWTDSIDDLDPTFLKTHVTAGGAFVLESYASGSTSAKSQNSSSASVGELSVLEEKAVGLSWESPEKRGMLYRSFYLLQTFDGCVRDETKMLTLRKKQTAKSPMGIVTSASFFSQKDDCFKSNVDYRERSFVNLMYTMLTTDYKEDQLQLPELLNRVRNLGLEP